MNRFLGACKINKILATFYFMFLVLTNTHNKIIFDNVDLNKQNYTLEVKILYEHITCFISKVYPLLKKLTVI